MMRRRTKLGVILEEHGRQHLLYATYFSFVFLLSASFGFVFFFFSYHLGLRRRFTRANFFVFFVLRTAGNLSVKESLGWGVYNRGNSHELLTDIAPVEVIITQWLLL